MRPIILQKVWKLRTDPFYPDVDDQGAALPKEAIERSLNPLIDPRVLPYYFDVYDWTASKLIGELSSQTGLRVFPTARTLAQSGALMVILSGPMESGLDSAANLLLHKVAQIAGGQCPLVVEIDLMGRDKGRNLASVAKRIIAKIRASKPVADAAEIANEMQREYELAHKEEENRKDATYGDMFAAFRDYLKAIRQPIVLQITGTSDSDSWVRIYESAKNCCAYLLIMTPDTPYAKTCYETMLDRNRGVAWIRAAPLDRAKARTFIENRLSAQRIPGQTFPLNDALFPFTSEALNALYEPAGGRLLEPTFPVGWLRRTLTQAFNEQLDAIAAAHANTPVEALESIDLRGTVIGRDAMSRAWELNNRQR